MENKFYKIRQSGGSYVVAGFYNPITKEYKSQCVRDYDYADKSRDDELYFMPIDEEVLRIYQHDNGIILVGDFAEVVKGRTIEHGFIGKVVQKKDMYDKYHRWIAEYIYFEDGRKININNCRLIGEQ